MLTVRGLASLAVSVGVTLTLAGSALAQVPPAAPPEVGMTEVLTFTTPSGFIDDVVAADAGRIAYVVADTASKAELHVYTHATKQDQVFDLSALTLHPIAISLIGQRAFVIGREDDGTQIAGLVELVASGKKPAG